MPLIFGHKKRYEESITTETLFSVACHGNALSSCIETTGSSDITDRQTNALADSLRHYAKLAAQACRMLTAWY